MEPIRRQFCLLLLQGFLLIVFTVVFVVMSRFIYVEFGWKIYTRVGCNSDLRCEAPIPCAHSYVMYSIAAYPQCLPVNQPWHIKCVHKSIRIYMGVIIRYRLLILYQFLLI